MLTAAFLPSHGQGPLTDRSCHEVNGEHGRDTMSMPGCNHSLWSQLPVHVSVPVAAARSCSHRLNTGQATSRPVQRTTAHVP